MAEMKNKKELKNLLSNGKIEEVIEELKKHSDEHIFNALTVLSNEFRENKEHELLNTRPQQDISIANNKLAKSLIDIIDGKYNDAPFGQNNSNLYDGNDFNFNLRLSRKAIMIIVITVVMILIIYLIFVFYILESSEKDPTIILG